MTSKEIREHFLEFFASKGHAVLPSASMVVKNDPTLMFVNAGMNQFKEWFLGNTPPKHKRVADTQKCLRVSGKHNDLEEVGIDTYHHTMFEMLGNWSFGDYFKKDAISWAWELLTTVYKLDPERLYATVFEGCAEEGVAHDDEAHSEWLKYLPADRILSGNKKDNFWEMGETGPCGPCSEIHIDLRSEKERKEIDGASLVNHGNPLVIEIWNLVFIQYNRKANGELLPLPHKHVDTGMGLERLCMAVQGKKSNYETDIFTDIIAKIVSLTGKKYEENSDTGIAMRVIADHIRAVSFSIADGQLPSNIKAGYVIRRILRRAVRYYYTFLDTNEPLLYKLVKSLTKKMGEAFPELVFQQVLIEKVIHEEEETFLRTLEKGIRMMDSLMEKHVSDKMISGEEAFLLYDTYGFPIDLSELIAGERGYTIDLTGFDTELEKQKGRSRKATESEEGDWIEVRPYKETLFVGYDKTADEVEILKYRKILIKGREYFQFVFDKTPFYAESGGQIGDTGIIESASGEVINITNTLKENSLIIHLAEKLPVNMENRFTAIVNRERREYIANNHTATHLLHKALRDILGTHVEQKGSLVNYNQFRFDFSHFEKLSDDIVMKVERTVNKYIRSNYPLQEYRSVPIEEARQMGAIALFGEKYGDDVRIIKFGDSTELCGGTHARATGNIGYFKIISESAIAAGIRRIEAVTGEHAENAVNMAGNTIKKIRELFNNTPDLITAIVKVVNENESTRKQVEDIVKKLALNLKSSLIEQMRIIKGVNIVVLQGEYNMDIVRYLAYMLRSELSKAAFIAGIRDEDKANLALMYTDDLVKAGCNASNDIKEAAKFIHGGGGGQSFFATAGGSNADGISYAIDKLIEMATK